MIPVSEFGKLKGLSDKKVIDMIREGSYAGKIIDGDWYIQRQELQKEKESRATSSRTIGLEKAPALSVAFFILSALSFLGGIVLAAQFWPGDPGYRHEWEAEAYTISIAWFMVGVIEAALFAAIGQGLSYLHRIVENTSNL
jgi:hypothetical protein